jgi:type I restriction enzyme S subunit
MEYGHEQAVADEITGGVHITPRRSEAGVLLLSARNVVDGTLSLHQVDDVPRSEFERITRRLRIREGDELLSCSGSVAVRVQSHLGSKPT